MILGVFALIFDVAISAKCLLKLWKKKIVDAFCNNLVVGDTQYTVR